MSPMLATLWGMLASVSPLPLNASFSIVVTLAGMATLFMFSQYQNAELPIVFTPWGMLNLAALPVWAKSVSPSLV